MIASPSVLDVDPGVATAAREVHDSAVVSPITPTNKVTTRVFSSVYLDVVAVVAIMLLAFVLSAHYNLAEALHRLTKPYEYLQLDELPVVLLIGALGVVWFAWRRYREARQVLRLRQEIERRLAETLDDNRHLARRFVDSQEAERRSLARELHDELGQYLNAIKLAAVAVGKHTAQAALHRHAESIVDNVDYVQRVVQSLIRKFRPVALDELGLEAALHHSIDQWRRLLPETMLHLSMAGDLEHCGESANLAIYRMVQESLTNISRHAHAKQVRIQLARQSTGTGPDAIRLSIEDDGVGTNLGERSGGMGLIGMRERTEMLGGEFRIASKPDCGFWLSAVFPVGDVEMPP